MTREALVEDAELRRYLLGRASLEATEAIDDALFSDSPIHARLRALEAEMLEEYSDGELADEERSALERRMDADVRLHQIMEILVALRSRGRTYLANHKPPSRNPLWVLVAVGAIAGVALWWALHNLGGT